MMRRWVQPREVPDADRLRAAVIERVGRRVRHLDIHVSPKGLILRGQANSYYFKQLIQEAALAACHLPLAANEIEVCPSSGSLPALPV